MLINIIATVCLLSFPTVCDELNIDVTLNSRVPVTCSSTSQDTIDEWQLLNTEFFIKKWDCNVEQKGPVYDEQEDEENKEG